MIEKHSDDMPPYCDVVNTSISTFLNHPSAVPETGSRREKSPRRSSLSPARATTRGDDESSSVRGLLIHAGALELRCSYASCS